MTECAAPPSASTHAGNVYKDAEHAKENQFFNLEDRKLLKKLLTRVNAECVAVPAALRAAAGRAAGL